MEGNVTPAVLNCGYVNLNEELEPYFQVACFLSMVGSSLIILTYVLFADLRTMSRLLLVFLSFMDFGTALSNSIGIFLNFKTSTVGCQIQAAFAIFCSLSSYLWTAAIAVYIYITIVRGQQVLALKLVKIFHVLAWGIPLIIVAVAGGLDILGYDIQEVHSDRKSLVTATVTGGWCFIRGPYPDPNATTTEHDVPPKWFNNNWYKFWVMIAGEAWEIGTFLFCLFVYILIKVHMYREKHHSGKTFVTRESFRVASVVDQKLTFIPVVFFLLHIWSTVRVIARFDNNHSITNAKWLLAAEGVGDSLQGAANGVMFCVFTAVVRHRFSSTIVSCCRSVSVCCQEETGSINHTNRRSSRQGGNVSDVVGETDGVDWPDHGHTNSGEASYLVASGR